MKIKSANAPARVFCSGHLWSERCGIQRHGKEVSPVNYETVFRVDEAEQLALNTCCRNSTRRAWCFGSRAAETDRRGQALVNVATKV